MQTIASLYSESNIPDIAVVFVNISKVASLSYKVSRTS